MIRLALICAIIALVALAFMVGGFGKSTTFVARIVFGIFLGIAAVVTVLTLIGAWEMNF